MTWYQDFSDSDLVALFKLSDGKAFSEIFRRYRSLLLLYTVRRVQDIELSKDMIHDLFADLWDKRGNTNMPDSLRPFLIASIKNRILDHYRHVQVSQKYLDHFNTYLKTNEDTTDHLLRKHELDEKIEKEVAALPPKMRIVFELSRNSHMSRKQISEHLNMQENAVRINMNRALKILKARFGDFLILFIWFLFACMP